jgi:hypothetical protein
VIDDAPPPESPPTWVPPAVWGDIAQAIGLDRKDSSGVALRLVCDPRMRPIWEWLKRRAKEMHDRGELEPRLAALPERYHLDFWGLSERLAVLPFEAAQRGWSWKFSKRYAPLPDQACAAFCACVMIVLGVNNKAVTRAKIDALANGHRRAAN